MKEFNAIKQKEKDPIIVKRLHLLHNAIEIVSVNGLPFNFLLSSGYQAGIKNNIKKNTRCRIQFGYNDNPSNRFEKTFAHDGRKRATNNS